MTIDDLSESFEKVSLGPRIYPSDVERRVLVGMPMDNAGLVWQFYTPGESGIKFRKDDFGPNSKYNILVKGGNGAYAPPGLLHNTFAAVSDGDFTKQLKLTTAALTKANLPKIARLEARSQGPVLNDDGTEAKTAAGAVKQIRMLSGETRKYQSPGGLRSQLYDCVGTDVAVGRYVPDLLMFKKDGSCEGRFRSPDDGLSGLGESELKEKFGLASLHIATQTHLSKSTDSLRSEGKNVQAFLDGFLHDGDHAKDMKKLLIDLGGEYWPVERVLADLPEKAHLERMRHGPSAEIPDGYQQPLSVIVKDGDLLYPVEYYSSNHSDKFQEIVENTKEAIREKTNAAVEIYDGNWRYNGAHEQLYEQAFDHSWVWVIEGEGDNQSLIPAEATTTRDFDRAYPPEKRFIAKVGQQGHRNGMRQNMASMHPADIPEMAREVMRSLNDRRPVRGDARQASDFDLDRISGVKMEGSSGSHRIKNEGDQSYDPTNSSKLPEGGRPYDPAHMSQKADGMEVDDQTDHNVETGPKYDERNRRADSRGASI